MGPPKDTSGDVNMSTSTINNFISLLMPVNDAQKHAFAAVGAICLVLGIGATLMKVLTQRRSGEKTVVQNWTFYIGMVLLVGFICASIAMFSFGDQLNVMAYAGASVASASFYTGALVFLRIAVLCLYQDMLFHTTRYWKTSVTLGCLFSTYSVAFIIASALQCKPATPTADLSRCINVSDLEIVIGIFDFIVNAVILAMPVKGLWQGRRNPDPKNNICYGIAFSLGFIACILSLAHAVAPAARLTTWSLLYPLTGLLTLTLISLAIAIICIPTFIRCRNGPIQSPTTTHPHLRSAGRSASMLSWVPGSLHRNGSVPDSHRGHARNNSVDTIAPSITDIPTDLEKSTDALTDPVKESVVITDAAPAEPTSADLPDSGARTNSLRSFTRLGSLTGAVKTPSFLRSGALSRQADTQPAPEPEPSRIFVQTEVQMSYEARRKAMSRGQSRSASPARGRKLEK